MKVAAEPANSYNKEGKGVSEMENQKDRRKLFAIIAVLFVIQVLILVALDSEWGISLVQALLFLLFLSPFAAIFVWHQKRKAWMKRQSPYLQGGGWYRKNQDQKNP